MPPAAVQTPGEDAATLNALLDRARALGPVLIEHRDHAEKNGALAEPAVRALHEAGLLKLWRPASLGGFEVDPVTYAIVAEEVAVHEPAAAWLMMAANNAAFDLRMAGTGLVNAIYESNPDALICSTFNKPLRAEPTDGGFSVTGQVAFASGCRHADWLAHTALAPPVSDGGQPRLLLVYHPRSKLEILDDWDALGLRGTSSNTIRADGVFVPGERTVELGPITLGSHHRGPLYRCPIGVLTATLPPVGLAALRVALETLSDLAQTKVPFAAGAPLKQRALAQTHFGRARACYRAVRASLHTQLRQTWSQAVSGRAFTLEDKADLFLTCGHALETCATAVREVATAAGTSGIYKTSPIERALRDAETLRHHAFGAEGRYANAAQVHWQMDVDFPFLAMD
jgi:alkylation response protein AidB-like acyl-CoA dehydrogenase